MCPSPASGPASATSTTGSTTTTGATRMLPANQTCCSRPKARTARALVNVATVVLEGKTILITGATGSFGGAFIELLLTRHQPEAIRVFSRDEAKQSELRQRLGDDARLRYLIGDIRDLPRLSRAMRGVDVVVHTAALKQVARRSSAQRRSSRRETPTPVTQLPGSRSCGTATSSAAISGIRATATIAGSTCASSWSWRPM
jgi:NADPH:quinone reductase-like Zn-dependent oxidoreductase